MIDQVRLRIVKFVTLVVEGLSLLLKFFIMTSNNNNLHEED